MKHTELQIDMPRFLRLAVASAAVLLPLNWSWHVWARDVPGSIPVYIVIGGVLYFVLLRWITGIRFLEISREGRFVVLSSMLLLILFLAFGRSDTYARTLESMVPEEARMPLLGFLYFSTCSVLLRLVVPYLLVRFRLRKPPSEYGYRLRGGTRVRWVYVTLFVVMIPLVFWASSLPAFQASYPQARGVLVGNQVLTRLFVVYHAAYFMVFLSGESFWRGYMTFGLGRDLDVLALPWMVMMYSIGHYGKPILEVNASIIAGYTLGYLALRHRSFFLGALLHWSIALMMDLAVLYRIGAAWN